MVKINRLLSADGANLYIHTVFPVGTKKQCKKYLKKVRAGMTNQMTKEIFKLVQDHLIKQYGHPGFIWGLTFNGSIIFVVLLTSFVCFLLVYVYISIKTWPLRKLKALNITSQLGRIDELSQKIQSFRPGQRNTGQPETAPMNPSTTTGGSSA